MTTEEARLARVETKLDDLRDDSHELRDEATRTRNRLHKLEGSMALLLDHDRIRAGVAADRSRRQDWHMRILMALVAIVAIVEPVIFHVLGIG